MKRCVAVVLAVGALFAPAGVRAHDEGQHFASPDLFARTTRS